LAQIGLAVAEFVESFLLDSKVMSDFVDHGYSHLFHDLLASAALTLDGLSEDGDSVGQVT